jgi:hypothetical protein
MPLTAAGGRGKRLVCCSGHPTSLMYVLAVKSL